MVPRSATLIGTGLLRWLRQAGAALSSVIVICAAVLDQAVSGPIPAPASASFVAESERPRSIDPDPNEAILKSTHYLSRESH
jgi:hypothetical protein